MAGNIVPRSDGGCNLGTPAKEFDKIYAKDIGGTLATKLAPLASPTLTGVPAAPTAAAGTSTTQIATTAFAAAAVSAHNADTGAHSGIIGSTVSTHNSSNAAHSDIRTAVSGKADGACPIKAWVAGTAYSVNDIVVQNKKIYQCTTANSDAAFDAAKWQEIGSADLSQYTKSTDSPMFNKRDVITTSGNYTAPVSGWYKITVKGGGGGGCGGNGGSGYPRAGASGGEGGTKIIYKKLTQNDTVAVVIGAGGAGGAVSQKGGAGGDSSVTIDGTVYTGGGAVQSEHIFVGGKGGAGDIAGASGCGALSSTYNNTGVFGGAGAGNGGGVANISTYAGGAAVANSGAGGAGGGGANTSSYAGGAGAAGFVWFEYFDTTI